ncbi:MAG TPA: DUF1572 family protein [Cyclobacteriaceae bacterium]|nr:DUF1572 family protein [Cyclobacteriaceae bacterium]
MQDQTLANFYERDLRRLIEEINSFKNEENIWKTAGSVKNSCGNLVLHIVGGSNFLIGRQLGKTDYVRNRDQEFAMKGVPRRELISQLEQLVFLITTTLKNIDLEAEFPIPFDDAKRTNGYVLTQLALHLNYHLGQVNYLRRTLE